MCHRVRYVEYGKMFDGLNAKNSIVLSFLCFMGMQYGLSH